MYTKNKPGYIEKAVTTLTFIATAILVFLCATTDCSDFVLGWLLGVITMWGIVGLLILARRYGGTRY